MDFLKIIGVKQLRIIQSMILYYGKCRLYKEINPSSEDFTFIVAPPEGIDPKRDSELKQEHLFKFIGEI